MKKIICLLCALCLLPVTLIGCEHATTGSLDPGIGTDKIIGGQTTTDPLNQNTGSDDEITDGQAATDPLNQATGTDEIIDYTVTGYADFIATAPEDLYKTADVVVEGTFGETINTYVCEHSLPVTQVIFNVESVNKGVIPKRSIIVEYYGGTVPMYSYLNTLTEEQIAKMGIDRSVVDVSKMTVTYGVTKESVIVNQSETYMLFLSYDAENDTYFILCDAYGACKMDDGLIYSLQEEKYVQADFE